MTVDRTGSNGIGRVVDPAWVENLTAIPVDTDNSPAVKVWPMCGPPNKAAQEKADAVYHANAAVKAVKDHVKGSGNVQVNDVYEPVVLHQGVKQATCTNRTGVGQGKPVVYNSTEEFLEALGQKHFAPDEFEDSLDEVYSESRATMIERQAKYGPANIGAAPGGALNGLRVRLHDKLARINNYVDGNAVANFDDDQLRDAALDVIGYGVIMLMVLDNTWPSG